MIARLTLISVFCFGCASKGFNRGEIREQATAGTFKPQFDDQEIKEAFAKKTNLPKPFKLAVYFKRPNGDWRWTEQDKALLEEIGKELRAQGTVSDIFPIVSSLVTTEDLKSLRLVAAKHQADALLIVSGGGESDRYFSKWGWTYALVVPTLFVNGSKVDTLFMTNATMWDVRNEFLYLTAESEATAKHSYPAAIGRDDKELLEEAKTLALAGLKAEVKKMVQGTKL